jgi:hypothetical protein
MDKVQNSVILKINFTWIHVLYEIKIKPQVVDSRTLSHNAKRQSYLPPGDGVNLGSASGRLYPTLSIVVWTDILEMYAII